MGERLNKRVVAWFWVAGLMCAPAHGLELQSDVTVLGQVRDGDQSRRTETPSDVYGDFGVSGLHHGTSLDTYFRLERDFGLAKGATDFYAGSVRVPSAVPGLDVTLGRQFLSEGPGGAFVADAGKIRFDPGGPLGFTVFGGQPRYFEPTFGAATLSQDEQIFGGNVHTTGWQGTHLSVGYFQQDRDEHALRQLVTTTASRAFSQLPGLPSLYGSAAYDAGRQNFDQGTAGVDLFLSQPRLRFNFEGSYYKPQDHSDRVVTDINRRQDPIFQLFSVSELVQLRGGLSYTLSRTLSAFGDYSYQNYKAQLNRIVNGHVGSAGVLWLPGGDGLEVVRLEYYGVDSRGGSVNGAKAYYESRVYERIVFRAKVDISSYVKENHAHDTAVSTLVGLGYVLAPGLTGEVDMEANRNQRFNQDFRCGFLITYRGRYRSDQSETARGAL